MLSNVVVTQTGKGIRNRQREQYLANGNKWQFTEMELQFYQGKRELEEGSVACEKDSNINKVYYKRKENKMDENKDK